MIVTSAPTRSLLYLINSTVDNIVTFIDVVLSPLHHVNTRGYCPRNVLKVNIW